MGFSDGNIWIVIFASIGTSIAFLINMFDSK